MNASIKKFLKEEDGVTALEYGLLAAVIAAVVVGLARERLIAVFTSIFSSLSTAVSNGSAATGGTGG